MQEGAAAPEEAVNEPVSTPELEAEAEPTPEPVAADAEEVENIVAGVPLGDATKGERAARACASCHTFDKGGRNGVGPNLWGVVGRDIASIEGARYSDVLKEMEGSWTLESLDAFIKNPREFARGTTMGIGAPQDKKRADILAYLQTLTDE